MLRRLLPLALLLCAVGGARALHEWHGDDDEHYRCSRCFFVHDDTKAGGADYAVRDKAVRSCHTAAHPAVGVHPIVFMNKRLHDNPLFFYSISHNERAVTRVYDHCNGWGFDNGAGDAGVDYAYYLDSPAPTNVPSSGGGIAGAAAREAALYDLLQVEANEDFKFPPLSRAMTGHKTAAKAYYGAEGYLHATAHAWIDDDGTKSDSPWCNQRLLETYDSGTDDILDGAVTYDSSVWSGPQFAATKYGQCPHRMSQYGNSVMRRRSNTSDARTFLWPHLMQLDYSSESNYLPAYDRPKMKDLQSLLTSYTKWSHHVYEKARGHDANRLAFSVPQRRDQFNGSAYNVHRCLGWGYDCKAAYRNKPSEHALFGDCFTSYDPVGATTPAEAEVPVKDMVQLTGGSAFGRALFGPCSLGTHLVARSPRMFCLARCAAANSLTGECADYASRLGGESRCGTASGSTETSSGYCRCKGGGGGTSGVAEAPAFLGRGCDRPVPQGHDDWYAFIEDFFATDKSPDRVGEFCRDHGAVVCSGAGWCAHDQDAVDAGGERAKYPFKCQCDPGFFGAVGLHEDVYNSEFNAKCSGTAKAESGRGHSVHFPGLWRVIKTRQCLFYGGNDGADWTRFKFGRTAAGLPATAVPAVSHEWDHVRNRSVIGQGCDTAAGHAGPGCRKCEPAACAANVNGVNGRDPSAYCVAGTHGGPNQCHCAESDLHSPDSGCDPSVYWCSWPAGGAAGQDMCSASRGQGSCPRDAKSVLAQTVSYGVHLNVRFSQECECEPGFGGTDGACSEQLCPVSMDPECLRSGRKDCKPVACGGHGHCQLPAGLGPHQASAGSGTCVCDDGWEVANVTTHDLGTAGTCSWRSCPGGCNNLTRAKDPLPQMVGQSVCDFDPEKPRCHCFQAITSDSGVGTTRAELLGAYWGEQCQHTFAEACSNTTDQANPGEPCSGKGYCYACATQRHLADGTLNDPRDCPDATMNSRPSCHCNETASRQPAAFGEFCENSRCNNGRGCSDSPGSLGCEAHGVEEDPWQCICADGWGGEDCSLDLTAVSVNCAHFDSHLGRTLVCGGEHSDCKKCEHYPDSPNCQGKAANESACICRDGHEGEFCQVTPRCGGTCASEGHCLCKSSDCLSKATDSPADWYCKCDDNFSKDRFNGDDAAANKNCGVDLCVSTGGTPASGSTAHCVVNTTTQVWDKARGGCRKLCPRGTDGTECGALNADGSSRCTVVPCNAPAGTEPVCDCSVGGMPDYPFATFQNTSAVSTAACLPTCEHCREVSVGVCDWTKCSAADRDPNSGLCRYTQASNCAVEACPGGSRVSETECDCPPTGCDGNHTCGPHGEPNNNRARCVCQAPYVPNERNGGLSCEDPCQHGGTANVTSGVCDCAAGSYYDGDHCEHDACTTFGRDANGTCIVYDCQNGGTPSPKTHRCDCPFAWDAAEDPACNTTVCQNGGTAAAGGTHCICAAGWGGTTCGENLCGAEQLPPPVLNASAPHGYSCVCGPSASFDGTACHGDLNGTCSGNGRLVLVADGATGYRCRCDDGFSGDQCETDTCGVRTNPRHEWNSDAGACGCKFPFTGYPGCASHVCGVGCPAPLEDPGARPLDASGVAEPGSADATHRSHDYEIPTVGSPWDDAAHPLDGVVPRRLVWNNATGEGQWSVRACYANGLGPTPDAGWHWPESFATVKYYRWSTPWHCLCPSHTHSVPHNDSEEIDYCVPICARGNTKSVQLGHLTQPCVCRANASGPTCNNPQTPGIFDRGASAASSGLSVGEKAGIGVGAIAGVFFATLAVLAYLRSHGAHLGPKMHRYSEVASPAADDSATAELY